MNKTIQLYTEVGDDTGKVQYIDHMGTDKSIVNAARVSFGQDNDFPVDAKDEKLIKYLMKHEHTSPFEHCVLTCKFTVPLFVRSQHHRHRTWAYNEISRRYTSEQIEFYEPKAFRTQHKSNRQASNDELVDPIVEQCSQFYASECVRDHHEEALHLYNKLLEAGVCREQARGVLPQNMYTQYYGTVNLGNLFKFIHLRTHEGAQWEIVKVAEALVEIGKELWPVAFEAWEDLRNEN